MESSYMSIDPEYYSVKGGSQSLGWSKYDFKKIWNPHWFQGNRKKKNYFEGWYFKNITPDGEHIFSFIPGVSMVGSDAHAFIQVINGISGETFYFRYDLEEFLFSKRGFNIVIGKNSFSDKGFGLDIEQQGKIFKGDIKLRDTVAYPAKVRRPGIMGWYRYMPFMECYHGLVSMHHSLDGILEYNGNYINFTSGKGYVEKDWGSSMPSAWIWMQTNHFTTRDTSFMLSVARIPWIRNTFTGFLGFLYHQNKTITFATYTGAKIQNLRHKDNKVQIEIKGQTHTLFIEGVSKRSGTLKAPVLGKMDRAIHESIDAEIEVEVRDNKGKVVFSDTGSYAGLEFVGDMESLKT